MIREDDVLPRATASSHFCQHFMRRTTQQTLLAINLASQQKTTKLYFSSQLRKQFKLLAVPFRPLRSCLQNDRLVPCLKILERSIITFFFFFQLQNGFRTSFLLSSRLSRFTTEFSRFMFGQKNKNKKKAALKSVFDIDFNKPLLIQQKYSFAIAIDLVVISKEVKRLYIYSNES